MPTIVATSVGMPRPRPIPRAILSPSLSPELAFVVWLAPVSEPMFAVGFAFIVEAGAEVDSGTGNVSYNPAEPPSSITCIQKLYLQKLSPCKVPVVIYTVTSCWFRTGIRVQLQFYMGYLKLPNTSFINFFRMTHCCSCLLGNNAIF
jgi:hypothetical protein